MWLSWYDVGQVFVDGQHFSACWARWVPHLFLRGGSSFFPRGGVWAIVHEPRSGEPIFFGYFTSREAASRFFWLFYEPRSGEPIFFGYLTSREAASRFFWLFYEPRSGEPIFLGLFYEPRSGEPIFLGLFWTPVSDVFLASTNAMETMITSLAAQGGGGGGG